VLRPPAFPLPPPGAVPTFQLHDSRGVLLTFCVRARVCVRAATCSPRPAALPRRSRRRRRCRRHRRRRARRALPARLLRCVSPILIIPWQTLVCVPLIHGNRNLDCTSPSAAAPALPTRLLRCVFPGGLEALIAGTHNSNIGFPAEASSSLALTLCNPKFCPLSQSESQRASTRAPEASPAHATHPYTPHAHAGPPSALAATHAAIAAVAPATGGFKRGLVSGGRSGLHSSLACVRLSVWRAII
jgi:hypothetical protein